MARFYKEMLDFKDTDGLFEHFEVNRDPFWPRISWLVAGSGAWHLVLLACILLIPPVRNAFSLAVLFSHGGFVDRPYNKTEIGDGVSEFTLEKFHYPEGYFLIDQQGMPIQQFPMMPQAPPVFAPAPIVKQRATPVPTPLATSSPAIAASSPVASPPVKVGVENKAADQNAAARAQKELEDASKKTGIDLPKEGEINKRPFKELAAHATELKNQGKLDFDKSFEVVIDTELDKNGKLVNPKVNRKAGDATLADLGKQLVEAMNDSGVLFYLKKINEDKPGTRVVFTIKQNGNDVVATVESEVTSPESARQLAAAFRFMLSTGAESRKGKDEEILLRNTTASADGKNVVFKLTMAHKDVVDIVKKGMEPDPSPAASPS